MIQQHSVRCDFASLNSTLEDKAGEGYELVAALAAPSNGETRYVLFFKRQVVMELRRAPYETEVKPVEPAPAPTKPTGNISGSGKLRSNK